jgi:hypothetical protein
VVPASLGFYWQSAFAAALWAVVAVVLHKERARIPANITLKKELQP